MNRNNTGVILYDRYGKEYFKFYEAKYKKYVSLSAVPTHVLQSIIVSEDREFYTHPGFSVRSILAAVVANIKTRDLSYGGSTITQQLVKNSLLNPRKNFLRKYQELVLASEIERRFTKDQILEMYINSVYFGEGAFGIEAASQTYFGKSVDTLTVSEASLLAGLLTSPSELSPLSGDLKKARHRQYYVLSEMVEEGYVTEAQMRKSLNEKLTFTSVKKGFPFDSPHFALLVKDQLIQKYGEERIARSGFKIYTTLDLSWQQYAEKVVKDQVRLLTPSNVTNGAAVVIEPETGEVRVLVGSHDWNDNKNGKVNMAVTPRQPGSAFKPIIYAEAFDRRLISPATILQDRPRTFTPNYRPKNYDGKFRGPVPVRRALANSLNVPSVEVMDRLGVADGIHAAKRFGITTLKDESYYGLSLVLGAGEVPLIELANVYAMLGNGGILNEPTLIAKIRDKNDKTVFDYKPMQKRVIDEESAYLISSILSDNSARQEIFGNVLIIPRPAAVKTGTTEDYRDSLTVGYTPQLAVGVWVGNNDNLEMTKIAGSIGAAPIWRMLMTKFLEKEPVVTFRKPENIFTMQCGQGTKDASSSGRVEYFIEGTQPGRSCAHNYHRRRAQSVDPTITGVVPTQQPTVSSPPVEVSLPPQPPSGVGGGDPVSQVNPTIQSQSQDVNKSAE